MTLLVFQCTLVVVEVKSPEARRAAALQSSLLAEMDRENS